MKNLLLVLLFIVSFTTLQAQQQAPATNNSVPLKELQKTLDSLQLLSRAEARGYAAKTTAAGMIYDTTQWAHKIDTTWGAGLSTAEKLNVFNTYWGQIDSFYASFTELPLYNWDSIINAMRTEISGGVSKGRFAGIIGQLSSLINDGHSHFYDYDLFSSPAFFGKPVLYGPSGTFGACITMLDDSSAMVYTAKPGNALGLAPGDRILGYNGIAWKELVQIILRHQLPNGVTHRSTDSATWHNYISSVLSNCLLFDTLNIEKCDGSLVNFPTSAVWSSYSGSNFCTEQLAVPGVHKMSYTDYYTNNRMVTSGVITGTGIGYVALYDCGDNTGDSLYNPIRALVEDSLIHGLIIDIRTNFGGSILTYMKAFYYLSDGDFPWMGWADRSSTTDRYTMDPSLAPPYVYGTTDDDPNFFNKKIALLVGPGAVSAGDMMQILYTHHPNLKIIGKPTAGAFGAYQSVTMPYSNYVGSRQNGDFYRAEDNTLYLSHRNFPIDSFVWFDRTKVCNNEDNILTTAIQWIQSSDVVKDIKNSSQATVRIFPVPSAGEFDIILTSPVSTTCIVSVYDMPGTEAAQMTFDVSAGSNKLHLKCDEIAGSGTYLVVIRGAGIDPITRKVMIIK